MEDTIECLESLKKITYPNYGVIVVDNGSEGNDVEVLREKFGDYIYLIENDKNYGFAAGNNIGIRKAMNRGADYVLLLNNDTVVAPDFLDELIEVASGDAKNGITGPNVYYYDRPEKICGAGGFINYWAITCPRRGSRQAHSAKSEDITEVDYIARCCMLISRDVLLTIGSLDERLFFWYEDVDLCIRAARHGFKILSIPKSKIWHKVSATADRTRQANLLTTYYVTKNRFILMEKHWSRLQFASSILCYVILLPKHFVSFLLHIRRWDILKSYLRGLFDYLRRK